jgi:hypothetical protein
MRISGAAILLGAEELPRPVFFRVESVYPQPLKSPRILRLDIRASGTGEAQRVLLYDMLGRFRGSLYNGLLPAGRSTLELDLGHLDLAPGSYLLRIDNAGTSQTRRISVTF